MVIDWLINPLECYEKLRGTRHYQGQGHNTLLLWLIPGDFHRHVSIDSSTHYPAFSTARLHCLTPTLMPACQEGRQFVPFFALSNYISNASKEADWTIFLMVLCMTWLWHKPMTYHIRVGQPLRQSDAVLYGKIFAREHATNVWNYGDIFHHTNSISLSLFTVLPFLIKDLDLI